MTSDTSELQAILRRIETLETANRRLRRVGVAVAVAVVVVLGMGQAKPSRSVEGQEFILRDTAGRERAALRMAGDSPEFALKDDHGTKLAVLKLDRSGPSLLLLNTEGKLGAGMLADAKRARLDLFDLSGQQVAEAKSQLTLEVSGSSPSVELGEAGGARRAILTVFDGNPFLWLADDKEMQRLSLSVNVKTNEPSISMSDAQGFETRIGSTDLVTPRTGETHKTSAASVVLFGKDRNVLWSAP